MHCARRRCVSRASERRRRRSRARTAGAAWCSAGPRCPSPRTRSRAASGRGRPTGRRSRRCCRRARGSTRPKRAATRGPTWPAHRRRAGRRDERDAVVVDQRLARGRGRRSARRDRSFGAAPNSRAARSNRLCVASAVSGVFSDGFQTTVSPQTSASAAFHAQTATGKLNAEMTPTTPSGCQRLHHPVVGALGGDGQAVQLARQADREVADVDHLLHFAQAFGDDLAGLDRDEAAEVGLVPRAAPRRTGGPARRGAAPAPCATRGRRRGRRRCARWRRRPRSRRAGRASRR